MSFLSKAIAGWQLKNYSNLCRPIRGATEMNEGKVSERKTIIIKIHRGDKNANCYEM
jgi:hypothetical protein